MSAHTFCKTIHSDLQNTKHTCMHYTQKYIKMSLPCNSKALTCQITTPMSHCLNTAIKCANTWLLNCRHTESEEEEWGGIYGGGGKGGEVRGEERKEERKEEEK